MIEELLTQAQNGIVSIYETKWLFAIFVIFLAWISLMDIKTKTIKNYQNLSFIIVGVIVLTFQHIGWIQTAWELGWGHLIGLAVGFLLLFIPGMILNYAFGGDIKFVAVLGFWIGGSAVLLLLIVATFLQGIFLTGKSIKNRALDTKASFPFAPAFSIAYLLMVALYLL